MVIFYSCLYVYQRIIKWIKMLAMIIHFVTSLLMIFHPRLLQFPLLVKGGRFPIFQGLEPGIDMAPLPHESGFRYVHHSFWWFRFCRFWHVFHSKLSKICYICSWFMIWHHVLTGIATHRNNNSWLRTGVFFPIFFWIIHDNPQYCECITMYSPFF